MPIIKRKLKSGAVSWGYYFDAPGSTRENRQTITKFGYSKKSEAIEAEASRRLEVKQQAELQAAAPLPKTLGEVIEEFIREHAERNVKGQDRQAADVWERYQQKATVADEMKGGVN